MCGNPDLISFLNCARLHCIVTSGETHSRTALAI